MMQVHYLCLQDNKMTNIVLKITDFIGFGLKQNSSVSIPKIQLYLFRNTTQIICETEMLQLESQRNQKGRYFEKR